MPVSLAAIRQMIKNRQYDDARSALRAFLSENPKSAEGWYLLSLAGETTPKRLAAARKAAKLAPNNARVRARLEKLQASPKAKSGRGRLVLLLVTILALVIVGIVFVPRIIQPQNQPQATAQAAQPTAAPDTPAAEQTETPVDELIATEEIVSTPEASSTPTNTATHTPTAESSPTTPPTATAPPATAAPTLTSVPPTTVVLAVEPTTLPTVIVPVGVVLYEAQDVSGGQMWIVAAERSAETLIRELGGFIDSAPPGYEWVLVELFMICSGTNNCAPQPSALQVVGPSRTPYNVPEGFEIEPVFGPNAYMDGQVWGYVGFIVPNSETTLSLLFTQSGQQYAFDLQ